MFLESIAANLVNKFCRRFVKDFKKENLSFSLSGEVVLTQFELNTDEIKQLQLPVELKSFCVGKLRLRVPLAHLTTQSAEIELIDVSVLLGTPREPKWDLDSLYVAEQSKIFLMTLLLDHFASDSTTPSTPSSSSVHHTNNQPPRGGTIPQGGPLTPSLVALIQNSHIIIERIHVRFEDGLTSDHVVDVDSATSSSSSYALGVTLASLVVLPSTPSTSTFAHDKKLSLTQLSIYLKSDDRFEDMSPDERAIAFRAPFERDGTKTSPLGTISTTSASTTSPPKHPPPLAVLEPLSLDVRVQMNLVPVIQLAVQMHVPLVHVNMAPSHYQYLDAFLTHVDRFDRYSLYRRFRPVQPTPLLTGEAKRATNWKDWWRYAIVAVMMDLNDPVRRKPTWRSTFNLVLVGLQYTALRRQITPFLIRQTTGTTDHHFLQYREDFKGNDSDARAPFDRSLTLASEPVPKHVTHFGDGIFAGVYGLYRCFPRHTPGSKPIDAAESTALRPAEPVHQPEEDNASAAAQAKKLWYRQLCIDASFRPIIVAKLRALAVRQLALQDHKTVVTTKLHNAIKGRLTLTVVGVYGIPKPMVLFCKVKVGHKGTPYTGDLVHCERSSSDSNFDALVAQSFEFKVQGTPNEDILHVNLFDRWPMFNQFVGKLRLPLPELTRTSYTDQMVAVEAADNKAHHRMQLHVLSVFVPDEASSPKPKVGIATTSTTTSPTATDEHTTPTFANSTAMMQALYPALFASKPHSMQSWYSNKEKPSVQSLTIDATLAKLYVAFVFPATNPSRYASSAALPMDLALNDVAPPSSTSEDQLVVHLQALQYRLNLVVPAHLKHALVLGRFDMHLETTTCRQSSSSAATDEVHHPPALRCTKTPFFQAPRRIPTQKPQDNDEQSLPPFASFDQVIDSNQPVQSKLVTQDIQVTVDVPVVLRHVRFVLDKVPERTVLSSLLAAPVIQAMMKHIRGRGGSGGKSEDYPPVDSMAMGVAPPAKGISSTSGNSSSTSTIPPTENTSATGLTSPRFLGSWKWTSQRPEAVPSMVSGRTATARALPNIVGKQLTKDRSGEFHAHIELGAMYIAVAGAASSLPQHDNNEDESTSQTSNPPNNSPLNVLEAVIPSSSLHVVGGKGLPTEVKSGASATVFRTEHDMSWVLAQLARIRRVAKRQLTVDARPFYDNPTVTSRGKIDRFEYEIHALERQLAHFRVLIRQVVAAPQTYGINSVDCDSLRLMVRDMQPKVIDTTPTTISNVQFDMVRMLLKQGMTVLKHNVRKGDPSWRVLWLLLPPDKNTPATTEYPSKLNRPPAALCLAKPQDRKTPKVLPLSSIANVVTNVMTPALTRTGHPQALDTYLVLQVVDELKPISLEFASNDIRDQVAVTLARLLAGLK